MDFFYVPWISTASNGELIEETEYIIGSIPKSVSTKPKYKLTSVAIKGFIETSRLILVYAGEPFINNRISYEQLKEKENSIAIKRLPMLEFEGHTIYQPTAIAKFLANQFGLRGKTVFEEAEINGIIETVTSLVTYLKPYMFFSIRASTPHISWKQYFPENSTEYSIPMIHLYLPILENAASKKTDHGFLLPSGLTYADFTVAICYEVIEGLLPQVAAPYTNLKALKEKVNGLPQLQQYLKNRPKSIF